MSQKLQNHLANGYEVKIGDYISRGWEIFKSNMGGYIGYFVLYGIIAVICNFIPLVNILSSIIITPCLMFGFHLVSNQISEKKVIPEFGTFFNGFQHVGKLALIALITLAVVIVCFLPAGISAGISAFSNMKDSTAMLTSLLSSSIPLLSIGVLVMLYFIVSWSFAGLIAVFHNKEAWAAMETSRKLISKNWFMMFLLIIVIGLISLSGVILLGFGLLFTIPLGVCCTYAAYEDIAGTDDTIEQDEISQIGSNLAQ